MMTPAWDGWGRWFRVLIAFGAVMLASPQVSAAPDRRELEGRQAFAAGRYGEALEIFAKLYAETLHPTYVRNIGRCYQNLREPDKAINSFEEYLRKRKNISPVERDEIDGYIREMRLLRESRANAKTTVATTAAPSIPDHDMSLLEPTADFGPADPGRDSGSPIYKRWWFWTTAAVVISIAAATVYAVRRAPADPACVSSSCMVGRQ